MQIHSARLESSSRISRYQCCNSAAHHGSFVPGLLQKRIFSRMQGCFKINCLPKTWFFTKKNLWRNQANLRSFYVDFELLKRGPPSQKIFQAQRCDRKQSSNGSLVRLILHSWRAPVDLWRTCGDLGVSLVILWWKPIENPTKKWSQTWGKMASRNSKLQSNPMGSNATLSTQICWNIWIHSIPP